MLHEYELPAFAGRVRVGAVAGVMPAYNLVNGRFGSVSRFYAAFTSGCGVPPARFRRDHPRTGLR